MHSMSSFAHTGCANKSRFRNQFSSIKSFGILAIYLLLASNLSTPVYAAVVEGTPGVPSCIIDQPGYSHSTVNCTANDLGLSSPLVTIVEACNFPGDFATYAGHH